MEKKGIKSEIVIITLLKDIDNVIVIDNFKVGNVVCQDLKGSKQLSLV